jgi:hypothetical protein
LNSNYAATKLRCLTKEAEWLQAIRPNPTGRAIWPLKAKMLLWRTQKVGLELKVAEAREREWQMIGILKG